MRFIHYFGFVLLFCFSSCEKESLETPSLVVPFDVSFETYIKNSPFVLSESYKDHQGRSYRVEMLKFYLSNWALEKKDGSMVSFGDVNLIDYSSGINVEIQSFIDTGTYVNLHFGFGLDATTNAINPIEYESSHPLSLVQNTYWTWASTYKFFMLEGRVDSSGHQNTTKTFSYHTGSDALYRKIKVPLNDCHVMANGVALELQMQLDKVLKGSYGTIDFVSEPYSHSEDDIEIAQTLSNNFYEAFEVK
jgi:hypothetical protein